MNATEVGVRLLRLRNARGISLRQLEEMSGINKSTLHKWETDKSLPTRDGLAKLAQLYNVTAAWLMFGRENESTEHGELLDDFECLDAESQQVVRLLIKNFVRLQSNGAHKNGT